MTNTLRVQGSDVVTRKIFEAALVPLDDMDIAIEVAEGNPGTAKYLVALLDMSREDPIGFKCLVRTMRSLQVTGSKFYTFIKDQGSVEDGYKKLVEMGWM